MINIKQLDSYDPDLCSSRLLDGIYKTMSYAQENNGVTLTKSGAFNRKFCTWAADNFNWPEYSTAELMRLNKVIDEIDIPPVETINDFLWAFKYGRYVKGKFQFFKKTHALAQDKGSFFAKIATEYLFSFNHTRHHRSDFTPLVNWDVFLNVINVEVQNGATHDEILKTLYGYNPNNTQQEGYWQHSYFLMWNVLKPLSWIGFLEETYSDVARIGNLPTYTKSALWRKSLRLDTDSQLKLRVVH